MKIRLFSDLASNEVAQELFLLKDENNREIIFYQLTNCTFTGYSQFYPEVLIHSMKPSISDICVLPYNEMTMSLKRGTRYETEGMIYPSGKTDQEAISDPLKEVKEETVEDPVFFFVYNTDNYFHFLYDTLPYLISYFELKLREPRLKLLMGLPNHERKELYRFVKEFLELLNIDLSEISYINSNTLYKRVYLSSSYTHNGLSNCPPRKEVYDLYNDLVKKATSKSRSDSIKSRSDALKSDKIYISRRTWMHNDLSNIGTNYTTRRMMMNEDELVETLTSKYGFNEVFTENMSTVDKILLFNNAKVVVGAIGGGISNVLFSKPETKLVAIVSPCFLDINKRFHFSLSNVDVKYYHDTKLHGLTNGFSRYMRIRDKESGKIGEITDIDAEKQILKVALNDSHGWNSEVQYKIGAFKFDSVDKLDEGLNSPYVINIASLEKLI